MDDWNVVSKGRAPFVEPQGGVASASSVGSDDCKPLTHTQDVDELPWQSNRVSQDNATSSLNEQVRFDTELKWQKQMKLLILKIKTKKTIRNTLCIHCLPTLFLYPIVIFLNYYFLFHV